MLRSSMLSVWKNKLEIGLALALLFTREVNITKHLGGVVVNNYIDVVISPAIIILLIWLEAGYKKIPILAWILLALNFCISWPELTWARGYSFVHTAIILVSWLFLVRLQTWKQIWWTLPIIGLFDHALLSSAYPVLIVLVFQKLYEVKKLFIVKPILIIQIILGIWQSLASRSLGLYIIGEKYLDLSSPGISKTAIGEFEMLRAYGTFAHPLIFGFLFLIAINFLPNQKLLSLTGILLSQSRAVLSSLMFRLKHKKLSIGILLLVIALISVRLFTSDIYRYQDIANWWRYVQDNSWRALLGTGLGQYPFALQEYNLYDFQYQPIHSIPLLLLTETGGVFLGFMIKVFARKNPTKSEVRL